MWALGRLAVPEGKTVILLCDPAGHGTAHSRSGEAQRGCCAVRDRPVIGRWNEPWTEIDRAEPADGPILVTDLDTGAPGTRELADRVHLLCALVSARTRAVVVLSTQPLPELATGIRGDPESTPEHQRRAG